jgi:membrane associated rhomboid family serine protease
MIPIRDSQPSYSKPYVVVLLIGLNILAFLFELSLDAFTRNDFLNYYGFVPELSNWPSILTSMFLHGGWLHLAGNMLFLWIYGDNIEDILGHLPFLAFYVLCGIAAALAQYLVNPDSRVPMIGASGAIAGVMGAYMVGWFLFVFSLELPAWLVLLYWLAVQFFSGAGAVADTQLHRGGVAFFAHIGGFVAGALLIHIFRTRDRYRLRRDLLW